MKGVSGRAFLWHVDYVIIRGDRTPLVFPELLSGYVFTVAPRRCSQKPACTSGVVLAHDAEPHGNRPRWFSERSQSFEFVLASLASDETDTESAGCCPSRVCCLAQPT